MTHFTQINFAETNTRRRKTLSTVMPVGDDWRFFVVLSDAYLSTEDGETRIRSFSDLRRAMNKGDSIQALLEARANGRLTEGRHELPGILANCLAISDAAPSHIRQWHFGASEPTIVTIASSALANFWIGSNIEEIEAVDESAKWYFRQRDDDPLIFLAVRDRLLLDQIKDCGAYCAEVEGNFEYVR